jgi:phosphomannomutase
LRDRAAVLRSRWQFPQPPPGPVQAGKPGRRDPALKETDAEIGIAFDGDGDRLGVVTKDGEIIFPDRQLMLFAADVLSRVPGGRSSTTSNAPACSPRGSSNTAACR